MEQVCKPRSGMTSAAIRSPSRTMLLNLTRPSTFSRWSPIQHWDDRKAAKITDFRRVARGAASSQKAAMAKGEGALLDAAAPAVKAHPGSRRSASFPSCEERTGNRRGDPAARDYLQKRSTDKLD